MEPQLTLTVDGQEVRRDELNLVAENAALADDRILAELVRLTPRAAAIHKAVIPFGLRRVNATESVGPDHQLVESTGAADASVQVPIVRAVIGGRLLDHADPTAESRDIRSAILKSPSGSFFTTMEHSPTLANNRWDLIYLRVDVDADQSLQVRFVQGANGKNSPQSVVAEKRTSATVGVVEGSEGATPARPALPADAAGAYYIPLAYVGLEHPHTSITTILNRQIDIIAPVVGIARSAGGVDAGPINQAYLPNGTIKTANAWDPGARPDAYMPPDMVGEVVRRFGLNLSSASGGLSLPLGATSLLDSSVDWRYRHLECFFGAGAASTRLPWVMGGSAPWPSGLGTAPVMRLAQTFIEDGASVPNISDAAVLGWMTQTELSAMASGSHFKLFVDMTDGHLYARVEATDPACMMHVVVRASGPGRSLV